MNNYYKPNKKYRLISSIIELICAFGLIGFSIYYYIIGLTTNFWLLLAFGVLFVFTSCRSLYKLWKLKKAEAAEENKNAGGNKNAVNDKSTWDMNTVGGNRK